MRIPILTGAHIKRNPKYIEKRVYGVRHANVRRTIYTGVERPFFLVYQLIYNVALICHIVCFPLLTIAKLLVIKMIFYKIGVELNN